jgi:hypothetical protein
MKKRLIFTVMMVGVFLSFTACSRGLAIISGPTINSVEDLTKFLASSDQNTAEKPYTINLTLGYGTDLKEVGNIIKNFGRYVNLDLSKSIELTSIGYMAFYGCTTLTGITIPRNVTSIGYMAFYGCTALTSVTVPDSVTIIEDMAFAGCTALTSVTIPNSVTYIGNAAFSGCTALTSVTVPDSVTYINERAFYGCTALTSVTLSRRTGLGRNAFPDTTRITYSD